jgi:hypothetical protein
MQQLDNLPPMENNYLLFPCTHTSLAKAYGISRKMLYKKLRPINAEIGERKGYKFSLEQLFIIISHLGWPPHPIPESKYTI